VRKILVANDDGIFAEGINILVTHLLKWGKAEITVVAPDRTKNATSHSLTLDSILRLRKVFMPKVTKWLPKWVKSRNVGNS